MSQQQTPDEKPAVAGAVAPGAGGEAPSQPAAAEPAPPTPEARLAELEGQIADLTDRLLRAHAEMDNIRKRSEKEKSDTQKYAVTRMASDLLSVGDNLQRAMAAVPAGAADADPALKALLDGVSMTEREYLNVLSRHGIKPIAAKGETFNPHLHQAVMEQQNTDVAAGSILQVFQEGFTIEERVLRPSMVVVAKGGFKPVKPVEPSTSEKPADAEREAAAEAKPEAGSAAEAAAKAASETAGRAEPPGFGKRTTPPGQGPG